MQGDRDRCMAAGMNDHVAKPIEPEDLWKALLKWIKPRHDTASMAGVTPQKVPDAELPFDIKGLDVANGHAPRAWQEAAVSHDAAQYLSPDRNPQRRNISKRWKTMTGMLRSDWPTR